MQSRAEFREVLGLRLRLGGCDRGVLRTALVGSSSGRPDHEGQILPAICGALSRAGCVARGASGSGGRSQGRVAVDVAHPILELGQGEVAAYVALLEQVGQLTAKGGLPDLTRGVAAAQQI